VEQAPKAETVVNGRLVSEQMAAAVVVVVQVAMGQMVPQQTVVVEAQV
jgi:hypothetical protein